MHYDPSPATYLATSAIGAAGPLLASVPAAAALLPAAGAVAEAAPWWGPLLLSGGGIIAGPALLWLVKTLLGSSFRSIVAAGRVWTKSIRAKAAATPSKADDLTAEAKAAAIDAALDQLEESGKQLPFGTKGE